MTNPALIPVLSLADRARAETMLAERFGFVPDGAGRLALGSQIIEVRQDAPAMGHGLIDHLALTVDDVDAALDAALKRGAMIDLETTPDGPKFIPEFWTAGTRYIFLQGPEGARIELCARPETTRHGLPGHDHIGIGCRDFLGMRAFFLSLGLTEIAATTLIRTEGNVAVTFLGLGQSVVELYAPPDLSGAARPTGHWSRIVLEGSGLTDEIKGPEGLVIERRD